ncbi:hypothetical protein ACIQ7Q_10950 [Streptomyces sp. NPDC096176]|uniref:hypothetical protein n=1 Tax=Streptomyces sp. NPDC096176 TaxID=3366079 RepID=UPI0037F4A6AB
MNAGMSVARLSRPVDAGGTVTITVECPFTQTSGAGSVVRAVHQALAGAPPPPWPPDRTAAPGSTTHSGDTRGIIPCGSAAIVAATAGDIFFLRRPAA